jgi:serine protease Do
MRPKILIPTLIALAAIAVFSDGYVGRRLIASSHAQTTAIEAPATQRAAQPAIAQLPDFSQLVERYGPAVVNITVDEAVPAARALPQLPFGEDDPFFRFFRHFALPVPKGDLPARGTGSGFIVSPDGYILTNAPVVANATSVTVKLSDRREFKAKVVGADRRTDVALLNGNPVTSVGELRRRVRESGNKAAAILVERGDAQLYVPVPVG